MSDTNTETGSETVDDFDFDDSSDMDTSDFTDGDDDGGELRKDTVGKNMARTNIKSRIRSARNWMIANIVFLIFVITLLGVFYALGWMKFESNFNESIN